MHLARDVKDKKKGDILQLWEGILQLYNGKRKTREIEVPLPLPPAEWGRVLVANDTEKAVVVVAFLA